MALATSSLMLGTFCRAVLGSLVCGFLLHTPHHQSSSLLHRSLDHPTNPISCASPGKRSCTSGLHPHTSELSACCSQEESYRCPNTLPPCAPNPASIISFNPDEVPLAWELLVLFQGGRNRGSKVLVACSQSHSQLVPKPASESDLAHSWAAHHVWYQILGRCRFPPVKSLLEIASSWPTCISHTRASLWAWNRGT